MGEKSDFEDKSDFMFASTPGIALETYVAKREYFTTEFVMCYMCSGHGKAPWDM